MVFAMSCPAGRPLREGAGTVKMFSMAALAVPRLVDLDPSVLARLGVLQGTGALLPERAVLHLDWPELEHVLPDRGLPRGVIELASPPAKPVTRQGVLRGGATTIALAAIRAVHLPQDLHEARSKEPRPWCAWITPSDAPPLYAPAVVQAGVDLERLLVVRPAPAALARTAIKVAASGAFELVVVDAQAGLDGRLGSHGHGGQGHGEARRRGQNPKVEGAVVVRKLALAAEEKGTTCILLSNAYDARATPWPVSLRLEVERRPEAISVRVTKDRRGRGTSQHVVRLAC